MSDTPTRRSALRCLVGLSLALAALAGAAHGVEPAAAPVYPAIKFAESLPVVKTVAEKEGIVAGQIDSPADRGDLRPGDSITALVTLSKGDDLSQWLVVMTCAELNADEKKRPVAKAQRLYSSTGTEIILQEDRAAMVIRVLGPYKKVQDFHDPAQLRESVKSAKDVGARITVNADFLRVGFDRACESVLLVREAMTRQPDLRDFAWSISEKPFPADVISAARAKAELLGLTPERERAFVGASPALREFWRLASRTPGLQDIVRDVADLPWWAIIKKGGEVKTKLKPAFAASIIASLQGIPGGHYTRGYAFPFEVEVNGEKALSCTVVAVGARPPLLAAAGILGIAAQSPDGKGPHLMVQIWSARLAESPGAPAAVPVPDSKP